MMNTPNNYGTNWTKEQIKALRHYIEHNAGLEVIATRLGRTPFAIKCKARDALDISFNYWETPVVPKGAVEKALSAPKLNIQSDSDSNWNSAVERYLNQNTSMSMFGGGRQQGKTLSDLIVDEWHINNHTEKEENMNPADMNEINTTNPVYEERTLVYGRDVSKFSEQACLEALAALDSWMTTLENTVDMDSSYFYSKSAQFEAAKEAVQERLETFA